MVDVSPPTHPSRANGSWSASAAFGSPISAVDVAAVRQRTESASLLPPRVYHDPAVFAYEQESWFAKG